MFLNLQTINNEKANNVHELRLKKNVEKVFNGNDQKSAVSKASLEKQLKLENIVEKIVTNGNLNLPPVTVDENISNDEDMNKDEGNANNKDENFETASKECEMVECDEDVVEHIEDLEELQSEQIVEKNNDQSVSQCQLNETSNNKTEIKETLERDKEMEVDNENESSDISHTKEDSLHHQGFF